SHAPPPSDRYTPSLHDALPISGAGAAGLDRDLLGTDQIVRRLRAPADQLVVDIARPGAHVEDALGVVVEQLVVPHVVRAGRDDRSEEHTSELQSRENLVCRLLR